MSWLRESSTKTGSPPLRPRSGPGCRRSASDVTLDGRGSATMELLSRRAEQNGRLYAPRHSKLRTSSDYERPEAEDTDDRNRSLPRCSSVSGDRAELRQRSSADLGTLLARLANESESSLRMAKTSSGSGKVSPGGQVSPLPKCVKDVKKPAGSQLQAEMRLISTGKDHDMSGSPRKDLSVSPGLRATHHGGGFFHLDKKKLSDDMDDISSPSTASTGHSSPQAASLLLRAMRRKKAEGLTPRTPPTADDSPAVGGSRSPQPQGLLAPLCRSPGRKDSLGLRSHERKDSLGLRSHERKDSFNSRCSEEAPSSLKLPDAAIGKPAAVAVPSVVPDAGEAGASKPPVLARENSRLQERRGIKSAIAVNIEKKKKSVDKETLHIRELKENEKIYDLYYWSEVIQEEGCGGKVVVCTPKDPNCPMSPVTPGSGGFEKMKKGAPESAGTHVMKIKSKAKLRDYGAEDQFRRAHLKMLNLPPHCGILPLFEVLENDQFYYVVMERAKGGSLLTSLVEEYTDGSMPEKAVKRLMKEILAAIDHLHMQGILHRDIKLDNLVVQVYDEPTSPGGKIRTVKLIDFDIADADWEPDSPGKKSTWVGTVRNSAPETFRGNFSQRSDLYSVGTVLYVLMAGRQPFEEGICDATDIFDNLDIVNTELADDKINWDLDCWKRHPACRDFCKKLLAFDPEMRPASAKEAATHPWFRQRDA